MKFKLLGIIFLGCFTSATAQNMDKKVKYGEMITCKSKESFVYPDFKLTYNGRIVNSYKKENTENYYTKVKDIFLLETPSQSIYISSTEYNKEIFTLDSQNYYELQITKTDSVTPFCSQANEEIEIKIVKLDK